MLTPRQLEVLTFIDNRLLATGTAPTYSEMGPALGITGRNALHQIINKLVEGGFLRRIPQKARALEVVRHPLRLTDLDKLLMRNFIGNIQMDAREDNDYLAVVLCAYFDAHPDKPQDGRLDPDVDWHPWVIERVDAILDEAVAVAFERVTSRWAA